MQTIHIHSMLRIALRKQLNIERSSKHKESTNNGKKLHAEIVSNLKKTLRGCLSTGTEIDPAVVKDMLSASEIGNEAFSTFVSERPIEGSKSFFAPIKRVKLNTGILAKKKTIKAASVLKEDCQFCLTITTFPLSIATPEGTQRQSDKSSLRNFLIALSKSPTANIP